MQKPELQKFQIPIFKLQTNPKLQISMTKTAIDCYKYGLLCQPDLIDSATNPLYLILPEVAEFEKSTKYIPKPSRKQFSLRASILLVILAAGYGWKK